MEECRMAANGYGASCGGDRNDLELEEVLVV